MRGFVRSEAYMRVRLGTGALFLVLGIAIAARTVAVLGIGARALLPLILGAALVTLGLLRIRDFLSRHGAKR